jgi:hypothetical protein
MAVWKAAYFGATNRSVKLRGAGSKRHFHVCAVARRPVCDPSGEGPGLVDHLDLASWVLHRRRQHSHQDADLMASSCSRCCAGKEAKVAAEPSKLPARRSVPLQSGSRLRDCCTVPVLQPAQGILLLSKPFLLDPQLYTTS